MRSMRIDCAPVRIETWPELEAYMDGSAGSVGRIMAPLLGVPERHHAGYGRLGLAFQLTNFIRDVRRGHEPGSRLPAGRGPRALRRRGAGPRGRARLARAAGAARPRGPPGARAVRRDRARDRRRPAPRCAPACASPSASTCACSTASSGSTSTCWAGARACAPGRCPAPRWERCAGDAPGDAARRASARRSPATRPAPTCWSAAPASPGWRSRASWPAAARTCSSSTATSSASARPRPAPRRRRGCTRWACATRSARSCRAWRSTRRTAPRASGCRGAGRRSTTGRCATSCGTSATRASRSRT